MNRWIALLFGLFFVLPMAKAQDVYTLTGRVVSSDGTPKSGVNIYIPELSIGTSTNAEGRYTLHIESKPALINVVFSHMGYHTHHAVLHPEHALFVKGKAELEVGLKERVFSLPAASISAEVIPERIYKSNFFHIVDFAFYQDQLVLLTNEGDINTKAKIRVVGMDSSMIAEIDVPDKGDKLYKDYLDRIHFLGEDAVFQLYLSGEFPQLFRYGHKDFAQRIKPCVELWEGDIIFSDFQWYLPRMTIMAYNNTDQSVDSLRMVVDEERYRIYTFQYYHISPKARLEARKLEDKIPHLTKEEIGGMMAGYHNEIFYEPVYAPVISQNDTLHVFDHYKNYIYHYKNTQLTDSVAIDYHLKKRRMKWKKELLHDEITGKSYTVFEKNGNTTLIRLDPNTGEELGQFTLTHRYPERLTVRGGEVYYLYKPVRVATRYGLFKERVGL